LYILSYLSFLIVYTTCRYLVHVKRTVHLMSGYIVLLIYI